MIVDNSVTVIKMLIVCCIKAIYVIKSALCKDLFEINGSNMSSVQVVCTYFFMNLLIGSRGGSISSVLLIMKYSTTSFLMKIIWHFQFK